MRTRHALVPLAVVATLVGCAAQQAHQRPSQLALADCSSLATTDVVAALYAPGKVQQVEPTYRKEFLARAIQPRYVSGALLYVPAEPGVNRAYLERALTCHAASSASLHPHDPLRADGVVGISVSEAGPAMRIAIVGADRAAGKAIYQRAQALHAEQGDVSVQQLSAAPSQKQNL